MQSQGTPRHWTLPNALTLVRLGLIPFCGAAFGVGALGWALGLLLAAALLDLLDGLTARLLDQRTALGRILDPLADKLLVSTLLVASVARGTLPGALAVLVLGRDLVLGLGTLWLWARLGAAQLFVTVRPTRLGKYTLVAQLACLALCVEQELGWGLLAREWRAALIATASLLTSASLLHDGVRGLRALRRIRASAPLGALS